MQRKTQVKQLIVKRIFISALFCAVFAAAAGAQTTEIRYTYDAADNANYRIEIVEAGETGFKAQAISVVDFDKDGQFNVWEIDQDKKLKEVVKD